MSDNANAVAPIIGAYVSVSEANEFINSHITNYFETNKYPVKSLIFNAEMLRKYLNDYPQIQNMKFMLGVKPDAGGDSTITMVIVGYDLEGNYVKIDGNTVLDNCAPCPYSCPAYGDASHDNII
jgi:hypothetical protein